LDEVPGAGGGAPSAAPEKPWHSSSKPNAGGACTTPTCGG
jgi:hypothetical protein